LIAPYDAGAKRERGVSDLLAHTSGDLSDRIGSDYHFNGAPSEATRPARVTTAVVAFRATLVLKFMMVPLLIECLWFGLLVDDLNGESGGRHHLRGAASAMTLNMRLATAVAVLPHESWRTLVIGFSFGAVVGWTVAEEVIDNPGAEQHGSNRPAR
jgi:hypothetical protein